MLSILQDENLQKTRRSILVLSFSTISLHLVEVQGALSVLGLQVVVSRGGVIACIKLILLYFLIIYLSDTLKGTLFNRADKILERQREFVAEMKYPLEQDEYGDDDVNRSVQRTKAFAEAFNFLFRGGIPIFLALFALVLNVEFAGELIAFLKANGFWS